MDEMDELDPNVLVANLGRGGPYGLVGETGEVAGGESGREDVVEEEDC